MAYLLFFGWKQTRRECFTRATACYGTTKDDQEMVFSWSDFDVHLEESIVLGVREERWGLSLERGQVRKLSFIHAGSSPRVLRVSLFATLHHAAKQPPVAWRPIQSERSCCCGRWREMQYFFKNIQPAEKTAVNELSVTNVSYKPWFAVRRPDDNNAREKPCSWRSPKASNRYTLGFCGQVQGSDRLSANDGSPGHGSANKCGFVCLPVTTRKNAVQIVVYH